MQVEIFMEKEDSYKEGKLQPVYGVANGVPMLE